MALRNKYSDIVALLKAEMLSDEDPRAATVIASVRGARKRGFLTKDEFVEICRWKSPRPLRLYTANDARTVRRITAEVFATSYEKRRLELLTTLRGVSVPTASAVLMATNPRRYGVIDIRVWQLLYRYGSVTVNPSGTNFSFADWYSYLVRLRYYAKEFDTTARLVERTLFEYDRRTRRGTLAGSRAVGNKTR